MKAEYFDKQGSKYFADQKTETSHAKPPKPAEDAKERIVFDDQYYSKRIA